MSHQSAHLLNLDLDRFGIRYSNISFWSEHLLIMQFLLTIKEFSEQHTILLNQRGTWEFFSNDS